VQAKHFVHLPHTLGQRPDLHPPFERLGCPGRTKLYRVEPRDLFFLLSSFGTVFIAPFFPLSIFSPNPPHDAFRVGMVAAKKIRKRSPSMVFPFFPFSPIFVQVPGVATIFRFLRDAFPSCFTFSFSGQFVQRGYVVFSSSFLLRNLILSVGFPLTGFTVDGSPFPFPPGGSCPQVLFSPPFKGVLNYPSYVRAALRIAYNTTSVGTTPSYLP